MYMQETGWYRGYSVPLLRGGFFVYGEITSVIFSYTKESSGQRAQFTHACMQETVHIGRADRNEQAGQKPGLRIADDYGSA